MQQDCVHRGVAALAAALAACSTTHRVPAARLPAKAAEPDAIAFVATPSGEVHGSVSGTEPLWLAPDGAPKIVLDPAQLARVRFVSHGRGALEGFGLGGLGGLALGLGLGLAAGDGPESCLVLCTREERAAAGGLTLGVIAGAVGLIVGLATGHHDDWIAVPASR
jgi:hypothetical protein